MFQQARKTSTTTLNFANTLATDANLTTKSKHGKHIGDVIKIRFQNASLFQG